MSDAFYRTICAASRVAFVTSGRAAVLGAEHVPPDGRMILAANHVSWYDIPLLALHCPRILDFLAITELYHGPVSRWFFNRMNGIRYDRFSPDSRAVREMMARLARGRVVVIFPEGKLCPDDESLFSGHAIRPGMSRLAMAAQVPVLPVVLLGTDVYRRFRSWLPVRRARYGILFGKPLAPPAAVRSAARRTAEVRRFEAEYCARMRDLRIELLQAMSAQRHGDEKRP
jgi:1-acyl-sn-glycerol-3-phosphate acyltransferase